jgi:hypothetical protein
MPQHHDLQFFEALRARRRSGSFSRQRNARYPSDQNKRKGLRATAGRATDSTCAYI